MKNIYQFNDLQGVMSQPYEGIGVESNETRELETPLEMIETIRIS